MKLKTKLMLLVLAVTLAAFGFAGVFSVSRMKDYALTMLAESEGEKLDAIGRAFRQVGTREDFEAMGEIARDAYLKYQFRRCYEEDYGLLKDGTCLVNLTDYDIAAPEALTGEYMVQEVGGKHVFLLKRPLEYPEGFEVLAVRDVSQIWAMLERQAASFAGAFLGIALIAVLTAAWSAGRLLGGLGKLEAAAKAIGRGQLGTTVEISSRDEIKSVAAAFNHMSLQVSRQVEDLQLLLGALAHEMKTPVTSVMGYADSLLHVRLSEEQRQNSLERIYQAGARMERMSAKLMNLIGMYENDAVQTEEILAKALFDRILAENQAFLSRRQVSCQVDCGESLMFLGDEELLDSLFSNLIQNSGKASQPGGIVEVTVREGAVRVKDSGCGIPEKDLPNVTKAFYMADRSRSRSEGGSGLGLALADRIAALHGGRLEIASQEGVGTEVTVFLPSALVYKRFTDR